MSIYQLKGLKERRGALRNRLVDVTKLNAAATEDDLLEGEALSAEIARLTDEINSLEQAEENQKMNVLNSHSSGFQLPVTSGSPTVRQACQQQQAAERATWKDQDGRPVHVLAKGQRWADLPYARGERDARLQGVGVGDVIRAMITGKSSPEIRAAMGEGANSTGGYLVPEELMRDLVDLARARSVLMQAGAQTVPMASDLLRLARLATDPVFEMKEENQAFTGSDATFDAITFTSKTVGTLITCSRELAADAPNFTQIVEQVLSNAFAAKLDDIGINGISGTHLDGILDWTTASGIGETGSVGGIEWADISTGAVGVRLQNFEPNAVVLNPDIYGDLSMQATGDGANSSKGWIPAPRHVENLTYLQTTGISTASVIIGQFDQAVWAIRQDAMIEVSQQAGDAFAKHQVLVKLTWRGDFGAFRRNAFWRLTGVTT